jgi:predicted HicB family RNase H-like nuclease
MKTLTYKGYQASVEYEDGQLIIQLLHIDDFITATCDSAAQVEDTLHELVDDYIATCEETGRPANKPYKGSLNIRMTADLHRCAAMAAVSAGVSLNAWIVRACEFVLRCETSQERRGAVPSLNAGICSYVGSPEIHSYLKSFSAFSDNIAPSRISPTVEKTFAAGTVVIASSECPHENWGGWHNLFFHSTSTDQATGPHLSRRGLLRRGS